ncbi:hypothetical protein KM1_010780 [Entamoeba histolytica HM-3:IMSS]|uniref:Uncharacterized protein n=5 Tax=Entamoeba histolytica TaxID=5759 RepID=C4M5M1_ENTH1|nr:hypothetical protein, conserved [Entamoeba histolytica HM-1:IMSS]EMD42560.1 Hypothetical protein EHI5A_010650 [Entamoeba histolytica KU27]EMS16835.1 hypothetical protein KM1_010780 [Entamoeba histolytica HM-3:IMSS]ENY63542.1 hypothetical protein EHI7A_004790 [Entamoeba histolytica HM-1:IMSS-A]GAT96743.1 hypothetical protein conserved [Entamoeba histolytica]EAL48828.1 hypothetical protein, conserved [Entamoeba histolytica HM-1:IMSS]|eukprot:XP_654214.1 hypothetical protein, conserved [Entamoeba histolytica HM-1:IMSS]
MGKINVLIVILLCIAVAGKTNKSVEKMVENAVQKQMAAEYARAFKTKDIEKQNRTAEEQARIRQIEGKKKNIEIKGKNVTAEIEGVNKKITYLMEEQKKINETINYARQHADEKAGKFNEIMKKKIEEYQKNKKEMERLTEKREELNDVKIENIRSMGTAKTQVEEMAEEMRNRRRMIGDLERKEKRRAKTAKIVARVRKMEYQKLVKRLKELEMAKEEIRRIEKKEEMKDKAIEKKEARERAITERKRKILNTKLKAAKIAENAEMINMIYKQLAELKIYKKKQIQCARRTFEKYKEKEREKIEKKKGEILDRKLKNEIQERKGQYLMKVKREIQEEIDRLRLEKEAFDEERKVENRKIEALKAIGDKEIKESKKRLSIRKEMMKMKREELLREEMRTMRNKNEEYSNRVKKDIMKKAVESSKKMNQKRKMLQESLRRLDTKIALKKKVLKLQSQDANMGSALERLEIQKLKDQYYRLAALKERQKMQIKASKELLKHNTQIDDLEDIDNRAKYALYQTILSRKGVQKTLIRDTKKNSKEALEELKKKLKKEFMLKKKIMNLKRCLRTRIAMNDEIKRKEIERRLKVMIKRAVIARLNSAKTARCVGKNELVEKMMKK